MSKNIQRKPRFSIVNFPSEGVFYENKKKSVLVKFLTAEEEYILSDHLLFESNRTIPLLFDNVILDDDINFYDLVLSDFQAILLFLRATAYGDDIDLDFTCSSCGEQNKSKVYISQMGYKEPTTSMNKNGEFQTTLNNGWTLSVVPLRLKDKIADDSSGDESYFSYIDDDGQKKKVKRTTTSHMISRISEINGYRDKNKIANTIMNLPKKFSMEISSFIEKHDIGLKDDITLTCNKCGNQISQKLKIDIDSLKLPEERQSSVLEEEFLMLYHGENIHRDDFMKMPVFERNWMINRLKSQREQEKEQQNEQSSKSGGRVSKPSVKR